MDDPLSTQRPSLRGILKKKIVIFELKSDIFRWKIVRNPFKMKENCLKMRQNSFKTHQIVLKRRKNEVSRSKIRFETDLKHKTH